MENASDSEDPSGENGEEAPQSTEDALLKNFREAMLESNKMGAILYLGSYEAELGSDEFYRMFSADIEAMPFIRDIPRERMIEEEGYYVFCLIPADPNASVSVNEWIVDESNDYLGEAGDILYHSESGEPVLMRGGGEYLPCLAINMADSEGRVFSNYRPGISGEDGRVLLPVDPQTEEPMLFDYSSYGEGFAGDGEDQLVASGDYLFLGEWYAHELYAADGSTWSIRLNLKVDGLVEYFYGPGESDELMMLHGAWDLDSASAGYCSIHFESDETRGPYSVELQIGYYGEGSPYIMMTDTGADLPGLKEMGHGSAILDLVYPD
ncbi:MAG: hypothetical protein Q4B50_06510 [Bacillota bacterium]|nr:hypothetical protein [Bacillota bacterium]